MGGVGPGGPGGRRWGGGCTCEPRKDLSVLSQTIKGQGRIKDGLGGFESEDNRLLTEVGNTGLGETGSLFFLDILSLPCW